MPVVERILARDIRAIARAATFIENRAPGCDELVLQLARHAGKAKKIGITGALGAGKSTVVSRLVKELRSRGDRVAVLAIDPSSPFTGGAILGDRVRMQEYYADAGVYIRSMATRGNAGGIAAATSDMAVLLDAAGFDTILIETVGVGQDEVEIMRVADVTALVLVPGMGDDVQAIKAGIMEIADVYILNKADYPGIERLEREIAPFGPTVRCVATEGVGIGEVLALIERSMKE